jgi:hypothetical protein
MERPIMNPTTFYEDHKRSGKRGRFAWLRPILGAVVGAVQFCFSNPFSLRKAKVSGVPHTLGWWVRGITYRLLFAPVLVVLAVAALVYAGTHRVPPATEADPATEGCYFDSVSFASEDGTPLEAWLVPVIDAKRVLSQKEQALHKKHPAVVLVHDGAATRQQMLPLVKPLHNAGIVLLVVGLRGSGRDVRRAQTFGLNESMDVRASIQMMRNRPYVDPTRVAVVGVGTGASATLLAGENDGGLAGMVLADPIHKADDVFAERVVPNKPYLKWMRPLCKWAFEIAYHVDTEQLNLQSHANTLEIRPVLVLDTEQGSASALGPMGVGEIEKFLRGQLLSPAQASAH